MPRGTWGHGYWGRPMRYGAWGRGFFGRFASLLLVLFVVGALFKGGRRRAWHMHRAHKFGPHGFSHGHPWGHGPACCGGHPGEDANPDDAEAPTEEQVVKVQPEPDAD